MNPAAEVKIRMLRNSLNCFTCGLLGWLPGIGLPFALVALVLSGKVRATQKLHWNAARPYWLCGLASAVTGTLFWGFVLVLVAYHAATDLQ